MPITLTINGITYNLFFNLGIGLSPPPPKVLKVTFMKGPNMPARLGNIQLSPAPAGVTSRPCTVTFATGAPSLTVDMINPAATFSCVDTDTGTIIPFDANVVGPSAPGVAFDWNAAEVITAPPPPPTVLGVTFADAVVVAAAKKK